MTLAQILLLPVSANPRLIQASDDGQKYVIAAGAAGSTATSLGNATVPTDAPILPAQAFVSAMPILSAALRQNGVQTLDLSGMGISSITSGELIGGALAIVGENVGAPTLDLAGNSLNANSVNLVLAAALDVGGTGVLDLSGGTNAAPTGQGILDAAALVLAGWTVTTN